MYYEEKIIDGKLYYKTHLQREWKEVSYEGLLNKYLYEKTCVEVCRKELRVAQEKALEIVRHMK